MPFYFLCCFPKIAKIAQAHFKCPNTIWLMQCDRYTLNNFQNSLNSSTVMGYGTVRQCKYAVEVMKRRVLVTFSSEIDEKSIRNACTSQPSLPSTSGPLFIQINRTHYTALLMQIAALFFCNNIRYPPKQIRWKQNSPNTHGSYFFACDYICTVDMTTASGNSRKCGV